MNTEISSLKALPSEDLSPSGRRSSVYTPETIASILSLLERGCTETAACKQSGVIPNGWAKLKSRRADIRERVTAARQSAIRTRLEREQQQAEELRAMRQSARDAKPPAAKRLPKDIQFIRWHLATKVPLDIVYLNRVIIERACAHYGTPFERWLVYEDKHHLMGWVYKKRVALRGEHVATNAVKLNSGGQLPGAQEPEVLTPGFKIDPRYGKVRCDSRLDYSK